MNCPKCHHADFNPVASCPSCQFQGDSSLIEELTHIEWILKEISAWHFDMSVRQRQRIQETYSIRQRKLQVELDLRLPPFTSTEAQQAWPELFQRKILLQKMDAWQKANFLKPNTTRKMTDEAQRQIDELTERLEGHHQPDYPQTDTERLDIVNFLLEAANYLQQNQCFVTTEAKTQVQSPLLAEKEELEINLGLRPAIELEPEPVEQPIDHTKTEPDSKELQPQPAATMTDQIAAVAAQPPLPLGERITRALLSERTLQALLFLGIFLFFTAAISFVIWGWEDFSPLVRVAIPSAFTVMFFGLGWYVRTKTPMYRSGIALSAIAALLIPIDFYTIYVNFNVPEVYWAFFWFVTSAFCLLAYTAAAFIIRSRLYGYLIGLAAGSTVLALIEMGHETFGFSTDWRTTGLALVALGLLTLSIMIERYHPGKFTYFTESFRYLSVLSISIILLLTLGWRFIGRDTYDTLHYALSIDWWIGTIIFAWGALHYRHQGLGILTAIALPVAIYLTQAALFFQLGIDPVWHALGFAFLVPIYFLTGYGLQAYQDDAVLRSYSRMTIGTGIIVLVIVVNWSLISGNGWVITSSHLILAGTVVMAALLWQRPAYFYIASLFSMTAMSAAIIEWRGDWSLLSVAWTSLAIFHIITAWQIGSRFPSPLPNFSNPLVISGYTISAISIIPALIPYNGSILVYAIVNWIGLSAWGAYLSHTKQPGFTSRRTFGKTIFHWFTSVAIPIWIWLFIFDAGFPNFIVPLMLTITAWGLVILSYRFERIDPLYRISWWLTGIFISIVAPITAFSMVPYLLVPAVTLLSAGLLYFLDSFARRQSTGLVFAGLTTAGGFLLLLERYLDTGPLYVAFSGLIALYILGGLWLERKKLTNISHQFLALLYITSHILSLFLLAQIYAFPMISFVINSVLGYDYVWTDTLKLWAGTAQLILGSIYVFYAWGTYKERWGHVAAWLITAGSGLIAMTLSTGRGSSAAKAALLAIAFILAERTLYRLRQRPGINRQQAYFRLIWHLFRRPLLVTGWIISGIVIALALVRNLLILGGNRPQQFWATVALLLIVGLYATSARLFRQTRFMWLASVLIFAPWTILTHLGWFTNYYPTLAGYAISWMVLAWGMFLTSLGLGSRVPTTYLRPLKAAAYILVPFSLIWGLTDVGVSCMTFGLAVAFYILAAVLDHRQFKYDKKNLPALAATKFFYPAIGLVPVWSLYLLAWTLPTASQQAYGFLLLAFAAIGLAVGQWLYRAAPTSSTDYYDFPAYLVGFICMITGTLLVAYEPISLALALLYDAILLVISAWLFRKPVWAYLAAVVTPFSLLSGLQATNIPVNRYGWWLIGLASVYLILAWTLRRYSLKNYGAAPLAVGMVLVAVSLIPSSIDQTSALWGYGSAVILFAIAAFWLHQPLFLYPASILAIVPFGILIQRSPISSDYYSLALTPGIILALAVGTGLDYKFGQWNNFPWQNIGNWPSAMANRLTKWWGLPLFLVGFGLDLAGPLFSRDANVLAIYFLLSMLIFGWAVYYFRLRIWLLLFTIAGHLSAVFYLAALNWWYYPSHAWLQYLPVVLVTALVAIFIEHYWKEGSPLSRERIFSGWSRPLYLILFIDIILGQIISLQQTNEPDLFITITNLILITVLASLWQSRAFVYACLGLGVVALIQGLMIIDGPIEGLTVALASLALVYGILGYGITILRHQFEDDWSIPEWIKIWELPFQSFSIGFSIGILALTFWLGIDIIAWSIRALFGLPFLNAVDLSTIQMSIGVLILLGLLYLLNAVVYHRLRLGYVAIAMLLGSWLLQAFYIQHWANIQWYVIPTGLYLLGLGYFEWRQGNKTLGQWLDYLAIILMMGTLFWQTLAFGLGYAIFLGVEGFLFIGWGTMRRLRRFLYAGTGGVVLAVAGELVNQFWSAYQWIVIGIVALLVIITAIVVERKLDDIKAWQELETWE